MAAVRRVVLDILKPHKPNALEFARVLAEQGPGYRVSVTVEGVDARTESIVVVVHGEDIDFDAIEAAIRDIGGALQSIDEVEVVGGGT